MPSAPQRPRGTRDLLPAEQPYWLRMTRTAEAMAAGSGYQRVDTPIFEATELFVRTAGETSDVVTKEMYTFTDRGGRSMTLRPEGTATVVRAYFDAGMHSGPQPARLYYIGPFFRYDRPQAGRFRQFHQFGIEAIGDASTDLDVEVIALAWRWYQSLGLSGVSLQVNSIGDAECRQGYRDALRDYFRPYLESLPAGDRARFERNPLRLLDSKDPESMALLDRAPSTLDFLCGSCREAFVRVRFGLEREGVPFTINPRLVRGLDYYTRTTFEFWHESLSGAQNSLGGGGRYDGLAEDLGYRPTAAVGFALGLDRTAAILQSQRGPNLVYALAVEPAALPEMKALAGLLHQRGLALIADVSDAHLDVKLKRADRAGAAIALLVGLPEDGPDCVSIRDMRARMQDRVQRSELLSRVREMLGEEAGIPG